MRVTNPPRIWTCDVCGGESAWTTRHRYYGSIIDSEDMLGLVACSERCHNILDSAIREAGNPPHRSRSSTTRTQAYYAGIAQRAREFYQIEAPE